MLQFALALVALLSSPAAQAEVWVVDAHSGPGTDFTSIDAAVAVAADGDTILVRSGTYAPFPFGSKSLRVIADAGAQVSVRTYVFAPPMDIGPQPAGATTLLRGLHFEAMTTGPTQHAPYCLRLQHGQGAVWLESCTFLNGTMAAILVDGVGDVVIEDCDATGFPGAPALRANAGLLSIRGGRFTGGVGLSGGTFGTDGFMGAAGIHLLTGELDLSAVTVAGGKGGQPGLAGGGCNQPGKGGTGLVADVGQVRVRDALLLGGAGGDPLISGCPVGIDGVPFELGSATLTTLQGLSSTLTSNSPVREGETLKLRLKTEVSGTTTALLLAGQSTAPAFVAPLTGVGVLGGPTRRIDLGTVDPATGLVTFSLTIPELGPGVIASPWMFQAYVCSGGTCSVGGATHTIWLDSSL